jgi:hypothetical protein
MLKVFIHMGSLGQRRPETQAATLDVAYAKQAAMADYLVALSLRGAGELPPAQVSSYPRWSASLWDLTARALTQALYRADQAPDLGPPDRRCAYATRMCAAIELETPSVSGILLAEAQITQHERRGYYRAVFNEDILGERTGEFAYGHKVLNPADFLLRAICWTYWGQPVLAVKPKLIIPPTLKIDGIDRFDISALEEPARTGLVRYLRREKPADAANDLIAADDYAAFLTRG